MLKKLPPYQSQCVKAATHRINIAEGAVRSTKTVSMNLAWLRLLLTMQQTDGDLLMIGKTERTLKRNVLIPLQRIVGRNRCKLNAGTGELQLLGHTVYIAGANDERSHEKIAGLTVRAAYADEISLYPESMWRMLTSRLSMKESILLGTTNPASPMHYLKKGYLDLAKLHITSHETKESDLERPLNVLRMTFKLTDNPFLQTSFIDELKREFTGLWRRRYVDGEWVLADGAIYETFDPSRHVKNLTLIDNSTRVVGIDYGTTNPFSAHAVEFRSDALHVFSEYYEQRSLTDAQLAENFIKWYDSNNIRAQWICIDPSAASFRLELWKRGFTNLMNAKNDVVDGIRVTASLFSQDLIVINPSCIALQEELPGYSWDPKASEKGLDQPIKENDHACDDLRYSVASTENLWRRVLQVERVGV